MIIIYLFLIILFVGLALAGMLFEVIYFYGVFKTRNSIVYVPVSNIDLDMILKSLQLTPGAKLYDLGSGDGRVIKYALNAHPDIGAIGYEINPIPRILSRVKLKKYINNSHGKVQIINQDFYTANLRDATHIYLYLFPRVLKKLEPIFDEQLASGTRVVTVDYAFPNKQPIHVIDIAGTGKITKKIHVYVW